jgi:hypothetical protein
MSDIYSTQIVNPTRNSNTTLQISTLQSTNTILNKNYSFQSIRTIKGNIIANCISTGGNGIFTVLNMYDGTPIRLNYGDIVLRIVISNASNQQPLSEATEFFNPSYNNYTQPWNFDGNPAHTPKITFLLTQQPTYHPGVNTPKISGVFYEPNVNDYNIPKSISYSWTPNMNGTPIQLNSPFNHTNTGPLYLAEFPPNGCSIPVTYQNSIGVENYQWLTCTIENLSMNTGVAGINVNLLVLNPTSIQ